MDTDEEILKIYNVRDNNDDNNDFIPRAPFYVKRIQCR